MIKVEHVSKIYNQKRENKNITAVDDISFFIEEGDIVGYIGPNGSGKSTMIKMLCGILTPTKGNITVNGLVPYKKRVKNSKNIGVVFGQRTQLWWDLPLIDSFNILKQLYEVDDTDFVARMSYFDDIFNIKKLYNQTSRTLSLGERMKSDIVASMLHNPKVLFLDEPTIGLDFTSKKEMRQAILDINENYNTTIFITTHDLKDIETLCNKVIIVDCGKIIYMDNIASLINTYCKYRTIEVNNVVNSDISEIEKKLSEYNLQVKYESNKILLAFNFREIDSTTVLKHILYFYPNADILIKDESIEDIIERIYLNKGDDI